MDNLSIAKVLLQHILINQDMREERKNEERGDTNNNGRYVLPETNKGSMCSSIGTKCGETTSGETKLSRTPESKLKSILNHNNHIKV